MKSKIDVYRFKETNSGDWDEFVNNAFNGTMFHTRRFLSYHPQERFQDHSLYFEKKGKQFAVFPSAIVHTKNGALLHSHPGTTVSGFVTRTSPSLKESFDLVTSLVEYTRDENFSGIRITLPPDCYTRNPSNYLEFALMKNGFTYEKREVSSVLLLPGTSEDIMKGFKPSHRQAVRKAEKEGVRIELSSDFETFYSILKNNLSKRHNVFPTHSLKELELLQTLFPDRIILHGAFIRGKMIAGVVSFILNKRTQLAFYISHDENFQEKRALNLLFYTIFREAVQNGKKVFDFGIFTINEEANFGLARFKENFGARGVFRNTVELTY
ncbi:MAG: GNAT family N-acetyltransferase [Candidatus Marinimicrobia bacterium]|jgi:hypothetical protein|nr:GNAT family N-acetyltransferase [Candidatus Neomarinimicrobiota bacterium]